MPGTLRSKFNLALFAFALLFFSTTLLALFAFLRCGRERDAEIISRFDIEEKLNQLNREKSVLEDRLNRAKEELAKEKAVSEEALAASRQEQP